MIKLKASEAEPNVLNLPGFLNLEGLSSIHYSKLTKLISVKFPILWARKLLFKNLKYQVWLPKLFSHGNPKELALPVKLLHPSQRCRRHLWSNNYPKGLIVDHICTQMGSTAINLEQNLISLVRIGNWKAHPHL